MKWLRFGLLYLLVALPVFAAAQKVKLLEGSLGALSGATSFNLKFSYDSMTVTKNDIPEPEFVRNRTDELNANKPGKGNKWAAIWRRNRGDIYEPAFREALERTGGFTAGRNPDAQYTIILKTTHTETGYNVGVMRHKAEINAEAWIVETTNPAHVLARISIRKCPGKTADHYDFVAGQRLAAAYELAGETLGNMLRH